MIAILVFVCCLLIGYCVYFWGLVFCADLLLLCGFVYLWFDCLFVLVNIVVVAYIVVWLLCFVYFGFTLIIGCVGGFTLIVIWYLVGGIAGCLLVLDFINSVDVVDSCSGVFGAILDLVMGFRLLLWSLLFWTVCGCFSCVAFWLFTVFGMLLFWFWLRV